MPKYTLYNVWKFMLMNLKKRSTPEIQKLIFINLQYLIDNNNFYLKWNNYIILID